MPTHPDALLHEARRALAEAGLPEGEVVFQLRLDAFGDEVLTLQVGDLLLRFTRDRGQVFVDIGSRNAPEFFNLPEHIAQAFGWSPPTTPSDGIASLPDELRWVSRHRPQLAAALSNAGIAAFREMLRRAEQDRRNAMLRRARSMGDGE